MFSVKGILVCLITIRYHVKAIAMRLDEFHPVDGDMRGIHHPYIEHALINSCGAWTLRRILGQLTVRTVDSETTQGDELREVYRQDMRITTVSMATGGAGGVRVKFQHTRAVRCTRESQLELADIQGAVVAQWRRVRASCQDADSRRSSSVEPAGA